MTGYNIILAGVGGQGLITLARVIASTLLRNGFKSIIAETHGMSQRGGSVNVHIRVGDVLSPLVPKGGTDLIIGMELIEAVRALGYLRVGGEALLNDYIVRPGIPNIDMPSKDDLISVLDSNGIRYYLMPAQELASKAGNVIAANMVMFGALVAMKKVPGLDREAAINILNGLRFREINLRAFEEGYNYFKRRFR